MSDIDYTKLPFTSGDKGNMHYLEWRPTEPVLWLHIMHGMSEHSARYDDFARFLNTHNIMVTAGDHRGHGQTGKSMGKSYHVANENGWNQMIDDQWQLLRHIDSQNDFPLVILGHSMGSFMATHLCQKYNVGLNALLGSPLSAVILSGSNYANSATWKIASLIARIERFRVGRAHPSSLLEKISFGHFNNAFKPTRTSSDWLSRDPDIVDAYIADPLCGGPLTSQSWCDFLIGMSELSQTKSMAKLDKNLQIHLFAGQDDPVSNQSKGIIALEKVLLNAGISNVKKTIYPKARHEILNETNRSDVYRDVVTWLASLGFGISDPNKD